MNLIALFGLLLSGLGATFLAWWVFRDPAKSVATNSAPPSVITVSSKQREVIKDLVGHITPDGKIEVKLDRSSVAEMARLERQLEVS